MANPLILQTGRELYRFWEMGVPLCDSLTQITDSDLSKLYVRSRSETHNSFVEVLNRNDIGEVISSKGGSGIAEIFSNYLNKVPEQDKILRLVKNQIISFIEKDQYIALGYSVPRSPENSPVQIPKDAFSGVINWEKSEVRGNGLSFVLVRLISFECLNAPSYIQGADRPIKEDLPLNQM
jgi:hypothetical protein